MEQPGGVLCSSTLASPALRLRFKPQNRGTGDKLHEFTSQTQRFLLNLKRKSFNFTGVLLFFSLMRAVAAPSTQEFSINTGVFSPYASWDSSGLPEPLLSGFPFLTLKSLVLKVFFFEKHCCIFTCLSGEGRVPPGSFRGQRTTHKSLFSDPTVWVSGTRLGSL